jgi:uncharacterized protein YdhG (YjbR/CyaY superfamily)
MATTHFTSVDHYLSTMPAEAQPILQRVRDILRKALPGADEVISYQIPAYKIDGHTVIFFAGWKEHFSIYPASDAMVEAFGGELAGYKVAKGTIRFPLSQPVPVKLIERIVKFRVKEAKAEVKAKAKAT